MTVAHDITMILHRIAATLEDEYGLGPWRLSEERLFLLSEHPLEPTFVIQFISGQVFVAGLRGCEGRERQTVAHGIFCGNPQEMMEFVLSF